jgi:hypothetical protein
MAIVVQMFKETAGDIANLTNAIDFITRAMDTLSGIGKENEDIITKLDNEIKKFKV